MASQGSSFEAQLNLADSNAVHALLTVLEQTPSLKVAINHAAIAPIDVNSFAFKTWRQNIRDLNETQQVVFKFSGLEMQDRRWQWPRASYIFETLLDTVGTDHMMFASNFPVDGLCADLGSIIRGFREIVDHLSDAQRAVLFHGNAARIYRFTP